jgi:hypothetical protein
MIQQCRNDRLAAKVLPDQHGPPLDPSQHQDNRAKKKQRMQSKGAATPAATPQFAQFFIQYVQELQKRIFPLELFIGTVLWYAYYILRDLIF